MCKYYILKEHLYFSILFMFLTFIFNSDSGRVSTFKGLGELNA